MSLFFDLNSPLMRILSKAVDIIVLNFLFILCSIPLITIGASLTALYTVSMKMARGEDVYIWREFTLAFKRNFGHSTIIWLLLCIGGLILFADLYFLDNLMGIARIFFLCLSLLFAFILLTIALFIFPYSARFEDSITRTILNSFLIALFHFPYLILIMGIAVIPFLLVVSSFAGFLTGVYAATFGGFALFSLLLSVLFKKVFSKYELAK